MSEKTPTNKWRNIDPTTVYDVDTAHELAIEENKWHDAARANERVAAEIRSSGKPMADYAAGEWDSAAHYNEFMDGPIVVDAIETKLSTAHALEQAVAARAEAVEVADKALVQGIAEKERLGVNNLNDIATGKDAGVDRAIARNSAVLQAEEVILATHEEALAAAQAAEGHLNSGYIQGKITGREDTKVIADKHFSSNQSAA